MATQRRRTSGKSPSSRSQGKASSGSAPPPSPPVTRAGRGSAPRDAAVSGAGASTATKAPGSGPRRLGNQPPAAKRPQSASAARRYERSHRSSSKRWGWLSIALVVVVVAVFLAVRLTGSSSPSATNGVATGKDPLPAPAALVRAVTTVPASTFNSVGTGGSPAPFVVTKDQPALTSGGKARFVYDGAEYCPYCAMMRWSLVMALGRFGSFAGLKETSSGSTDADIPTFSFLGSTYKSPYFVFTPYEALDRQEPSPQPLQSVPAQVDNLYLKYDGSPSTGVPAKTFNPTTSAGIPFLDIANKYVSAGDPPTFDTAVTVLANGGPGRTAIADGLRAPTSAVGTTFDASAFVAQANYISAAICSVDGQAPASVCASSGVKAAAKALATVKPVG